MCQPPTAVSYFYVFEQKSKKYESLKKYYVYNFFLIENFVLFFQTNYKKPSQQIRAAKLNSIGI